MHKETKNPMISRRGCNCCKSTCTSQSGTQVLKIRTSEFMGELGSNIVTVDGFSSEQEKHGEQHVCFHDCRWRLAKVYQ